MPAPQFISPVVTPFADDLSLDVDAYQHVIDRALGAGLDGVLVMGSAGEFFTLSSAERDELTRAAVETVADRGRLMVGTGACSTREAVAASVRAVELGAGELMVISPYYFALDEQTLFEHFRAIASAVEVPVHLYNFPLRTTHDLTPALVRRIADECPNVRGIKDTVVDPGHTRGVLDAVAGVDGFEVFSGFDIHFALNHLMGGAGCISALTNVWPELCVELTRSVAAGDMAAITRCQLALDVAARLYDVAPVFMGAIKHAMRLRGVELGALTRTAVDLDEGQLARVQAILDDVEAASYSVASH